MTPISLVDFEKSGSLFLYTILRHIQRACGEYRTFTQTVGIEDIIRTLCKDYVHHEILPERDLVVLHDGVAKLAFPHPKLSYITADLGEVSRISSLIHTHLDVETWVGLESSLIKRNIISIHRDIRDIVVSWLHYAVQPTILARNPSFKYSDIESLLTERNIILGKTRRWVAHMSSLRRQGVNLLVLKFEDLVVNKEAQLVKLRSFLDVDFDIQDVLDVSSLERMRKTAPQHVRDGAVGGWRTLLQPDLLEEMIDIAGRTLEEFGYEGV